MAKNMIRSIKEMVGISEPEEYGEENKNVESSSSNTQQGEKSVKNLFIRTKEKEKTDTIDTSIYQSIIIKPEKFEDCKKIATYIKSNKTVTLNLENLNKEKAQRIIDFLSGAMSVKEAKFMEISKFVYVSVPKDINVFFEGNTEDKKESFIKF